MIQQTLPSDFIHKYQRLLGAERSSRFFAAIQADPVKAFRLNPLKQHFSSVQYDLTNPLPEIQNAYYGEINGRDVEQIAGYVYSQDPSAMYPAVALAAQPGDRVLDLCAAPGGKTTQLGVDMQNQGLLVANEINSKRVKALQENIERFGFTNTVVTNESPDRLAKKLPAYFDRILVDAPCSGEGMFRKDPEAINYWGIEYVLACQKRQKEIVESAYQLLKPGGILVYSTCTFSPEEDEQIIDYLLEKHSDMTIEDLPVWQNVESGQPSWTDSHQQAVTMTRRFWPDQFAGEGQFVAKLTKQGNSVGKTETVTFKKTNLTKAEQRYIETFLSEFSSGFSYDLNRLNVFHDHIYLAACPDELLKGLHVRKNGVDIGTQKKNRIVPHHSLALAITPTNATPSINLTDINAYQRFLHGETIKTDSQLRGFILVVYQQKVFSWGKIGDDQQIKNFLPKGLRW